MPRMASVLAAMAVVAGGQVSFGAVLYDDEVTTTWIEKVDGSDLAAVSGLADEGSIPLSPTTDFGFFEEEPDGGDDGVFQVTMIDDPTDVRDAVDTDEEVNITTIDDFGGEPLTEQELYDLATQSGPAGDGEVEITSSVPEPTAIAAALAMATAACAVGRRSRR
jgi:hypothetical protein